LATVPLFTIDDQLHQTYQPDREYIDGSIVERKLGRI
jgi:hypothetical protein